MAGSSLLFIGSLQRATPYFESADGSGITVFRFKGDQGTLEKLGSFAGVDNPSFLAIHPTLDVLYAVSEVYGWNEGMVTALAFDRRNGGLRYLNKQATRGSITAHVSIDRKGRHIFATNYAHERWSGSYGEDWPRQAVTVFPIDDKGAIGVALSSVQHNGSGPVAVRQDEPHPHCAIASPDNRFVVVADLGIDTVVSYRFDGKGLSLSSTFRTLPGAGPRHLKFSSSGDVIYLINELDSTVYSLAYSASNGALTLLHSASTIPESARMGNRCSEIILSPDGRFAYAANRGDDSIAILELGVGGTITRAANVPAGGRVPRNIAFDPSGRILFSANQESGNLTWFHRDGTSGGLKQIGEVAIGSPMCIVSVAIP